MYNNVVTEACNVSSITLGYIPKIIVGNNKDNNNINSLLDMSFKGFKWGE